MFLFLFTVVSFRNHRRLLRKLKIFFFHFFHVSDEVPQVYLKFNSNIDQTIHQKTKRESYYFIYLIFFQCPESINALMHCREIISTYMHAFTYLALPHFDILQLQNMPRGKNVISTLTKTVHDTIYKC